MTVRSLLRLRKQSSRHERDMNATYRPNPLISLERKQVSNPQVAGSNPAGDATSKFFPLLHSYLLPVLSSMVRLLDNFCSRSALTMLIACRASRA